MNSIYFWLLLISMSSVQAYKEPDMPPCPIHLQNLPYELPMNCKMPHSRVPRSPQFPGMPPYLVKLPPGVSTLPPDKMPLPMPYQPYPPLPPGMPPPPAIAMPMPMPAMPPHKLPVIVMPFYSQDGSKRMPPPPPHRHRRPRMPRKRHPRDFTSSSSEDTSDTDTDTSGSSSSEGGWYKPKQRKRKRKGIYRRANTLKPKKKVALQNLLTPVLQYVTKDGYVIFEKKITKNEAKDWLSTQNDVVKVGDAKSQPNKIESLDVTIKQSGKEDITKFKSMDDDIPEVVLAKKLRPKKPAMSFSKRDKVTRDDSEAES